QSPTWNTRNTRTTGIWRMPLCSSYSLCSLAQRDTLESTYAVLWWSHSTNHTRKAALCAGITQLLFGTYALVPELFGQTYAGPEPVSGRVVWSIHVRRIRNPCDLFVV